MISRGCSFIFLLLLPAYAIGCGGYAYELSSLKVLEDNDLLEFDGINITLDKNCEVVTKGCVIIKDDMENFTVTYNLTINENQVENTRNGCESFDMMSISPHLESTIKRFKLPEKCPVKKGKYCLSTKYNITKYQGTLGMFAGDNAGTVKIVTTNNRIGHYQYHATLSQI